MIQTGGENLASREVEERVFTHPAVSEVAAFGVLHRTWIEAVVVPRVGHSLTATRPSASAASAWSATRLRISRK